MYDNYISATAPFTRTAQVAGRPGQHAYPEDTIVSDMLAFSKVFISLWAALEGGARPWYELDPDVFTNLEFVVKPHPGPDDTRYVRFWMSSKPGDVEEASVAGPGNMIALGKTLRDGFGHFHYRWANLTPRQYFADLELTLPPALEAADRGPDTRGTHDYRIFILDWGRGGYLSGDGTRILETTFAHLRYHLACFLGRFFMRHAGAAPYTDILTQQKLTPHAEPYR